MLTLVTILSFLFFGIVVIADVWIGVGRHLRSQRDIRRGGHQIMTRRAACSPIPGRLQFAKGRPSTLAKARSAASSIPLGSFIAQWRVRRLAMASSTSSMASVRRWGMVIITSLRG